MKRNTIPADAYIELSVNNINEGDFVKQIDDAIRLGVVELLRWEQVMHRRDAAVTISPKIKIKRASDELMQINASLSTSVPSITCESSYRLMENKLLCQLEGSSKENPDQMKLFDFRGRPKGVLDKVTGELIEDDGQEVAGKINGESA